MSNADFSVKITVRNGRLLRLIRAKYGTVADMSRAVFISQTIISAYLTMRRSPILKTGEWSDSAYNMSSALGVEPEDLWPSHIAKIKLLRNEAEIDMSVDDVQDLISADRFTGGYKAIAKWAEKMQPRHIKAVVLSAGGATLDEIGGELGVSRERARQITMKGAQRLREAANRSKIISVEDMRL